MNVLIATTQTPNEILIKHMQQNKHSVSVFAPVHMMDEIAISCWDMVIINIEENIGKWTGLIKIIKNQYCLPIIGFIGNISLADMQLGIEAGINDYIFQESSDSILKKRLDIIFLRLQPHYPNMDRRLLRDRRQTLSERCINDSHAKTEIDEVSLVVDNREKRVYINNKEMLFSPKEFELLDILQSDPGRVFSPQEIIQVLWPDRKDATPGDVQQYIFLLRKKLRAHCSSSLIKTVKGFGYKLDLSIGKAQEISA